MKSEVKVWLRLIQKKYYEMKFEKGQGLESRFLVRKHEDVCTTLMSNLKDKVWKSLGHNEWWMDEGG